MNRMTSKGHESIFRMIAARAYHIYEDEGCPADKALDHWLRAEAEIRALEGSDPHLFESNASAAEPKARRRSSRKTAAA